ncbi:MAG: nicotinate-nucleotide--dimethylbenzimidazole phosphoribosyltransferase [Pseudomonadota bacterium]
MTDWIFETIQPPCDDTRQKALAHQLSLTKPPGSLGQLENVAVELCAMQKSVTPSADAIEIAVFAGDHGIVAEGVSAFPQAVTVEMVKNFVNGGAAISVLARHLNAGLTVVNAGTIATEPFAAPVIDKPVGRGTANFLIEDAMTQDQLHAALNLGRAISDGYHSATRIVIGGEMGIGNTTSATAIAAAITQTPVAALTGPGTGLDAEGVHKKAEIVNRALERSAFTRVDNPEETLRLLGAVGGFEIAALAGFFVASAMHARTIVVDGFISTSAAMIATLLNPGSRDWMLFSHASAEPGHRAMMEYLSASSLIDLDMRLGEGSGAAVACSLIRSACALHNEMATFEQASVSNKE